MRRLRWTVVSILALLALVFFIASFRNSDRLDALTVRFAGPGSEPADATVLGIGREHLKPDYRLEIVHAEGRFRCGTILNTSAADGIRFVVSEEIPLRRAQELILVEEDAVSDDLVTRVQFTPPVMSSGGYTFSVEASRSFAVGLGWFFGTALGKAVSAGIAIAVLLLILFAFGGAA